MDTKALRRRLVRTDQRSSDQGHTTSFSDTRTILPLHANRGCRRDAASLLRIAEPLGNHGNLADLAKFDISIDHNGLVRNPHCSSLSSLRTTYILVEIGTSNSRGEVEVRKREALGEVMIAFR